MSDPTDAELAEWLKQTRSVVATQAAESWTIARMRLVYPSMDPAKSAISVDTVSAAGTCNAQVSNVSINQSIRRIELQTTFNSFELRGRSHLLGPFRVLLQPGLNAAGVFRQRFATSLYPLSGEWTVPFQIETSLGVLLPRPTEPPITLKSAEPGEYEIPPIGSWFEKWDPISLVHSANINGPTVAIVEHAMHVMLNIGDRPDIPPFY